MREARASWGAGSGWRPDWTAGTRDLPWARPPECGHQRQWAPLGAPTGARGPCCPTTSCLSAGKTRASPWPALVRSHCHHPTRLDAAEPGVLAAAVRVGHPCRVALSQVSLGLAVHPFRETRAGGCGLSSALNSQPWRWLLPPGPARAEVRAGPPHFSEPNQGADREAASGAERVAATGPVL